MCICFSPGVILKVLAALAASPEGCRHKRMWPILRDARKSALHRMKASIALVIAVIAQDNGATIAQTATESP
jgi:fibrillarin-like rRNA methylase